MENNVMTPEEFYQEMISLQKNHEEDTELVHILMDDLMCELLEKMGYGKGVGVFYNTYKWYA